MITQEQLSKIAADARAAYRQVAALPAARRSAALVACAAALDAAREEILAANRKDCAAACHLSETLRDRLLLTPERLQAMIHAVRTIAQQEDPLDRVLEHWVNPANGLTFEKVTVPLGVIAMIYESRPNVTVDASALCLRSGNAVILRCGSESARSSRCLVEAMQAGLRQADLPAELIQIIPSQAREIVGQLLQMHQEIDVVIPRGGASLTQRVAEESRVPTLLHLEGNCHTYIHTAADPAMAIAVVHNAKLRRTGVCGATESLVLDAAIAPGILSRIVDDLTAGGCVLYGDATAQKIDARIRAASEDDWSREYLAPEISVKIVQNIEAAIAHINHYGSHHTDAIITADNAAAQHFLRAIDSAIVLHNASTQFADGGEFGFGAEIGIATGRLHARGPVGAVQLTTYKYVVIGNGTIRR
jgi:glutamate-5-semialdehyde dehydrogenase